MSSPFKKNEGYTIRYIYAIAEDGSTCFIQRRFANLEDARKWVNAIRRCQDMRAKGKSRLRRFFESRRNRARKPSAPLGFKIFKRTKEPQEDERDSFDSSTECRGSSAIMRHYVRDRADYLRLQKFKELLVRQRDYECIRDLANQSVRPFVS